MNMKIKPIVALVSSFVASADAVGFREMIEKVTRADADADQEDEGRNLVGGIGCFGTSTPAPAWHPNYSAGWTGGHCHLVVDCNSPSFPTELACCQGAYRGQISGFCVAQLPSPPTMSPTEIGGLDVFYPDYQLPWPDGVCVNRRPLPSGRPSYGTMLACCQGAYRGQMSGELRSR